jgi:hypothetical protein
VLDLFIHSSLGGMQNGLNYYRAFPIDVKENTESLANEGKI